MQHGTHPRHTKVNARGEYEFIVMLAHGMKEKKDEQKFANHQCA
jgi:hypothetical protein